MITNHRAFIEAITDMKMIRVRFHSDHDEETIDQICAPLDYGPETESPAVSNRYWVWDTWDDDAASRPIGLLKSQILSVNVLPLAFNPVSFGSVFRDWSVPRTWDAPVEQGSARTAVPV